MVERAIVCSVNEENVEVMLEKDCSQTCLHCGQENQNNTIYVANTKGLKVNAGDRVEIYLAPAKAIFSGFLIFILPLFLFILFYYIAQIFTGTENETIPAICGGGGVLTGLGLNFLIRKLKKKDELPEIMRVFKEKQNE
jgi:positive regulator of sigma E activity